MEFCGGGNGCPSDCCLVIRGRRGWGGGSGERLLWYWKLLSSYAVEGGGGCNGPSYAGGYISVRYGPRFFFQDGDCIEDGYENN